MKRVNPRLPLPYTQVWKIMRGASDNMKISKEAVELMIECAVDYIRQRTYKARDVTKYAKMRTIKKRALELAI